MAALKVYSKSGKERHFIALADDINALVEQLMSEEQQQEEQIDPTAEDEDHRLQDDNSNEIQPRRDDENDQQPSRRDTSSSITSDPLRSSTGTSQSARSIRHRSSSLRKGDITGSLTFALELEADLARDQDESSDDIREEDGTLTN